jgi:hypothetical protein
MYGLGSGNQPNGHHGSAPNPGVRWTESPSAYRTHEGKAAEKVIALLNTMAFDVTVFAHHLVSSGGNQFRKRILGIAIAIIKTYAIQYETGLYQDEVARDAMRLKDTCDQFKM